MATRSADPAVDSAWIGGGRRGRLTDTQQVKWCLVGPQSHYRCTFNRRDGQASGEHLGPKAWTVFCGRVGSIHQAQQRMLSPSSSLDVELCHAPRPGICSCSHRLIHHSHTYQSRHPSLLDTSLFAIGSRLVSFIWRTQQNYPSTTAALPPRYISSASSCIKLRHTVLSLNNYSRAPRLLGPFCILGHASSSSSSLRPL